MNKFRNHFGLILCVALIITLCCACNKTYSEFNPELTEALSEQYGISVTDSAKMISAEYRTLLKRDPSLRAIFEVSNEDLQDVFDCEMWDETDIEGAIQSEVGVETSIRWVYDAANSETYFYNAEVYTEHISEYSFRVHFCGFGVNSKYA